MNNKMYEKLNDKVKKTRLNLFITSLLFALIGIFFIIKFVESYNQFYIILISISLSIFLITVIFYLLSFIIIKVDEIIKKELLITIYRGYLYKELYINNELKKRVLSSYFLDCDLKDNTHIHVSFNRNGTQARLIISNNPEVIDL